MLWLIVLFILGLIVGSFLNVVIIRLKQKKSFCVGKSQCPLCKHKLIARDLIPVVSFLMQKGRCQYCQKKISWQYPLVELATGIIFLLVWLAHVGIGQNILTNFGPSTIVLVLRGVVFSSFLVVIFVYDLKHFLILDKVSVPLIIVALIFNLFLGLNIINLLVAAAIAGGFFLLQYLISKGRWIGGGDIRLGLAMGLMLGFPQIIIALFVAYLIGSVVSIGLLVVKKKKWGSEVPFGTFLSLATVIVLLYGDFIWQSYWNWVGWAG